MTESSMSSGVGANVVVQGVRRSAAPDVVVVVVMVVKVLLGHAVLVLLRESVRPGAEMCSSTLVTVGYVKVDVV